MSCFPCCKSEAETPSYRRVDGKVSKGRRTFKSVAAAMSLKTGVWDDSLEIQTFVFFLRTVLFCTKRIAPTIFSTR